MERGAVDLGEHKKFISDTSEIRNPVVLRYLQTVASTLEHKPINLCGGMPHSSTFPISEATITLKNGEKIHLSPEMMGKALQYQPGMGYEPLRQYLLKEMKEEHNPPNWEQRNLLMVTGGQEGISKSLSLVLNPGDGILTSEFTYTSTLSMMYPLRPKIIPVPCDIDGIRADKLREILEQNAGKIKIKAMYIIPIGENPTGITTSVQRSKEIYKLACEFDFLIIEDSAYQRLCLDEKRELPSFLREDTDNRVIRVDTFSKVMGPGFRIGWVTAPASLLAKLQYHVQSDTLHPSSFSQAVIHETLLAMGKKGYEEHTARLKQFYRNQRDSTVASAEKYLTGLAEWSVPSAGMFLWMKLLTVKNSEKLAFEEAMKAGVLVVPGNYFKPNSEEPSPYIRCSFAFCLPQDIDRGLKLLADAIRAHNE